MKIDLVVLEILSIMDYKEVILSRWRPFKLKNLLQNVVNFDVERFQDNSKGIG